MILGIQTPISGLPGIIPVSLFDIVGKLQSDEEKSLAAFMYLGSTAKAGEVVMCGLDVT